MQYYSESREKNLLRLKNTLEDFREKPQGVLSIPWLADIPAGQQWLVIFTYLLCLVMKV